MTIATFNGPGRVLVRIQDSGGGIEQEHLHRIYDPFFTTKTKPQEGEHKGTGLGLAVTYGIMQEHAGKIHVESEIGVGTAFQLEFPCLGQSSRDRCGSPANSYRTLKGRRSMSEMTELGADPFTCNARHAWSASPASSSSTMKPPSANRSKLC